MTRERFRERGLGRLCGRFRRRSKRTTRRRARFPIVRLPRRIIRLPWGHPVGETVKAKSDSSLTARRVIIWIYAGLFVGVGLLSGVFFFQTYQEYAQLRRVEADTRQRLVRAEQRLKDQELVLERLRSDPAFVEKIIRLQLRY